MSSILEMFGGEKHINPHYNIKAEKMNKDEMLKKMESILNDNADRKVKLEKENAELKKEWEEQVQKATDEGYARTLQTIQLSKAKELLKKIYNFEEGIETEFPKFDLVKWSIETRDFLKDSEVER